MSPEFLLKLSESLRKDNTFVQSSTDLSVTVWCLLLHQLQVLPSLKSGTFAEGHFLWWFHLPDSSGEIWHGLITPCKIQILNLIQKAFWRRSSQPAWFSVHLFEKAIILSHLLPPKRYEGITLPSPCSRSQVFQLSLRILHVPNGSQLITRKDHATFHTCIRCDGSKVMLVAGDNHSTKAYHAWHWTPFDNSAGASNTHLSQSPIQRAKVGSKYQELYRISLRLFSPPEKPTFSNALPFPFGVEQHHFLRLV